MYKVIFLIAFMFFSCRSDKDISLKVIDTITARKSYVDLDKRQLDSAHAANPQIADSRLEKAGLIENCQLQVDSFKFKDIVLRNGNAVINASYLKDEPDGAIKVLFTRGSFTKKMLMLGNDNTSPILICKADIIEGGFEEIVMLDKYYIVNGENSEVTIYEIK